MSYLLDTNILSEVRKPLPDEWVLAWLSAQRLSVTYLSVISIGELGEGIAKLGETRRAQELEVWLAQLTESFNGRLLDVDLEVVSLWGRIRARESARSHRTRYRRADCGNRPCSRPDACHTQRCGCGDVTCQGF